MAKLDDVTGINEIDPAGKTLITITDLMGRRTLDQPNTLLIYIYSDGSTEKMFSIEWLILLTLLT